MSKERLFTQFLRYGVLTGMLSAVLLADVNAGWRLVGSNPAEYVTGTDADYKGSPSTFLKSRQPGLCDGIDGCKTFGGLMQNIDSKPYSGKRVRLSANVRARGVKRWAGLWLRIDKGDHTLAFDNMESRPLKGNKDWQEYQVVLDVPNDATRLAFGTVLIGSGTVWVNDAKLEAVGPEVDVTFPRSDEPLPRLQRHYDHIWGDGGVGSAKGPL